MNQNESKWDKMRREKSFEIHSRKSNSEEKKQIVTHQYELTLDNKWKLKKRRNNFC